MHTHLHIVPALGVTAVESRSWGRDQMAHKAQNIYYLALYRKCLLGSDTGNKYRAPI